MIDRLRGLAEHLDDPPRGAWSPAPRWSRSTATRRRSARTAPVDFGVVGDARETAEALVAALTGDERDDIDSSAESRRSVALAAEIAGGAWRDEPYEPSRDWLDPRDAVDRARRDAAGRADRGRGLRRVHGLPVDVPAGPGRARLRLPAGVPVRRARAGERVRRGGRAAGPADGLRGRRRRATDGAARPRDARAGEARHAGGDLRRRGLRRRGPPLPADGHPESSSPSSRPPTSPRWRRPPAAAASRRARSRISKASASGSRPTATARSCWTPKSTPTSVPNG